MPSIFLHEELADALLSFKKENYAHCLYALNAIAAYNPEDVNCDFYRALCYYRKHQYASSVQLLDKCIGNRNNTFLQEATYYKALCLYESGETAAATDLFRRISEEEEFYAEKANSYLKRSE